jgi:hypothetical protein
MEKMERDYVYTGLQSSGEGAFLIELSEETSYERVFEYKSYYLPKRFTVKEDGLFSPHIMRVWCDALGLDSGWKRVTSPATHQEAAIAIAKDMMNQ